MKQILTLVLIGISSAVFSQEKISFTLPPASPDASFTQQLGNVNLTVSYSRPLAKGRKIFGGLVPFDSLWRTGASESTIVRFSGDVTINNNNLSAGKYALFTIPGVNEWTIIINADTTLHGDFGYESTKDVLRFKVKPEKSEHFYEAFTIDINDIKRTGDAFLALSWENTVVKIPINNAVHAKILSQINTRIIINKEKNAGLFFEAANYYYSTGGDLNQAAIWASEAEKLDKENFIYPNLLQKILADSKDYKGAIAAAKRAIALAEKQNMTNAVITLKKRVAEWESK